jgi:hypothetical protein
MAVGAIGNKIIIMIFLADFHFFRGAANYHLPIPGQGYHCFKILAKGEYVFILYAPAELYNIFSRIWN